MKKTLFIVYMAALLFPFAGLHAQEVKAIPYQTVVRDAQGNPMPGQKVNVRFFIERQLSTRAGAAPALLYSETHTAVSDADGMVRLQVGAGTPVDGSFATVDWWGKVYIRTELELPDANEPQFAAKQELGTVPYALQAETALLLTSDDGSRWSLECDNEGKLRAVKIPKRFTKLVFSDEFDGEGLLDPAKWTYEEGYVRNGEEQYYTVADEKNSYMKDGYLHLVCRNDSALIKNALYEKPWDKDNGGFHGNRKDTVIGVTSASVNTKDRFAFTYGRVEVRAKLPVCSGSWPAIWMFPQDESDWPNCGEIDIMEHVGNAPKDVHFTLHSKDINGNNQPNRYGNSAPIDHPEDWHTYELEWHPDRIMWYVDGDLKTTVIRSKDAEKNIWPFNKDFYFMLNFAFGGGWGGRLGDKTGVFDVGALPREYVIDYVRIYQ